MESIFPLSCLLFIFSKIEKSHPKFHPQNDDFLTCRKWKLLSLVLWHWKCSRTLSNLISALETSSLFAEGRRTRIRVKNLIMCPLFSKIYGPFLSLSPSFNSYRVKVYLWFYVFENYAKVRSFFTRQHTPTTMCVRINKSHQSRPVCRVGMAESHWGQRWWCHKCESGLGNLSGAFLVTLGTFGTPAVAFNFLIYHEWKLFRLLIADDESFSLTHSGQPTIDRWSVKKANSIENQENEARWTEKGFTIGRA